MGPERLQRLQSALVEALDRGEPIPGAVPGGRLDPAGAAAIYREGYYARLTSALRETFEASAAVLGPEGFLSAARAYIIGHPSRSYNLADYGEAFPAFLGERAASRWPFLGDLAAFEWQFKELFHSQEAPIAPPAALQAAAGRPDVRLRFTPAMRILRHRHAVYPVWRDRATGRLPDWAGPERLLVYKALGDVYVRPLSEAECVLLTALADGAALSEAISAVVDGGAAPEPAEVGAFFDMLARSGIVTKLEI